MSWFRLSSLIFTFWAAVFIFLPGFANEFIGIGYESSPHAEDWTRIVGLFALAFAVALNEAHGSGDVGVRRTVARTVLAFAIPCAVLMTYWQIMPDRRWSRLDILTIGLLYLISFGLFRQSGLRRGSAQ